MTLKDIVGRESRGYLWVVTVELGHCIEAAKTRFLSFQQVNQQCSKPIAQHRYDTPYVKKNTHTHTHTCAGPEGNG